MRRIRGLLTSVELAMAALAFAAAAQPPVAAEAFAWAEAEEEVGVSDSAGNSGFSAYLWAQKAESLAGRARQ